MEVYIEDNRINLAEFFGIKSSIEDVLYEIKISHLTPNTNVELLVNGYLLQNVKTDSEGTCIFRSKYTDYYRPYRCDSFTIRFVEKQPYICILYLDIQPMPEKDRRKVLAVHAAIVYRYASNIAENRPVNMCNCGYSDKEINEDHIKTAYNMLKLDETYGEYDTIISEQLCKIGA